MIQTKEIIQFCEEYLKVENFEDGCHNGLQIEGAPKVGKIITGVTLSQKLIETAIKKRAKMILVHHGIFRDALGNPPIVKGVYKNRIKLLLENNINLAAFHLPLDAHPLIGNNISLCRALGIKDVKPMDVGFVGELDEQIKFADFVEVVKEKLEADLTVIPAGTRKVQRIGVISGGSSPEYIQAVEEAADVYICGDLRENIVREVEEVKLNLINAGHYNTEKLGIKNLGELIAKKFGIKHEFIDIPNSI